MLPETVPEIRRCGVGNTVLSLKMLGITDVLGFDFIDPPSLPQMEEVREQHTVSLSLYMYTFVYIFMWLHHLSSVLFYCCICVSRQALQQLHLLGALDDAGCVTAEGARMARLPLDPPLSRMVVEAEKR
jgi:ATP-dependent RNA helicase DHX8/PRP22